MKFDLDKRRASLSVGDLSDFTTGPKSSPGTGGGIWRAQLGSRWHAQVRAQVEAEMGGATFEVVVDAELARRGWVIALSGRIDQILPHAGASLLREIKTVMRPLPAPEDELRREYPEYFVQLAAYAQLRGRREPAELLFIEADTGLAQTVAVGLGDEALLESRLASVCEFLDQRLRSRERLRSLSFRPPFEVARPGQAEASLDLRQAVRGTHGAVLLEAPTGFGKTGVLLECALEGLRDGHYDRVLYLTGKATGQLQVLRTLGSMTPGGKGVEAWHVRNKAEHCVNSVFQCVRQACGYLDGAEERWGSSGLSRFYLVEGHPRDIASLRQAGGAARICPYEITRAALAFNDLWIGDYNYVFSPETRGLFFERPGFDAARSLLVVDEAHNLASRAADAHSHAFRAADALGAGDALRGAGAPNRLQSLWDSWASLLASLPRSGLLDSGARLAAEELAAELAGTLGSEPLDYAALGPEASGRLWSVSSLAQQLRELELARLWWSPQDASLSVTCLDAAPALARSLGGFGGVVLSTATPGPIADFAGALGLVGVGHVRAATPWRDHAYDVAVDVRVDTTFQQRHAHLETTAATVAALHGSAGGPIAVFFPSYAYADAVAAALGARAAVQPRRGDLGSQHAWIERSLGDGLALLLVLGSGFAEGIDLLGGRVRHAMVVGPALPEVNAVQRAKMEALAGLGREAAFGRVYRIPGMQKVNQALGRLVRAPGQSARVLLHCRRFAEPDYARLLAPEYQAGRILLRQADFDAWLGSRP